MNKIAKETEEILEIMHVNVDKVKDRGEKLEVLDERAETLMAVSKTFQKTTKVVAQQEKLKNRKWKLVIGLIIGVIVLATIIIIIVFSTQSSSSSPSIAPSNSPQKQQ